MSTAPTNEERLAALEQHQSRMDRRLDIAEKNTDNHFWIFAGVTLLTWAGLRHAQDRIDKVDDLALKIGNGGRPGYLLLQEAKQ